MKKLKKYYTRNFTGSILPVAALLIAAIIPLCGITADMSYYGILRSTLEKATEAASVAGAQEYFRSKADSGKAIDETVRVFKMNITSDTMIGNYHSSTGPGNPSTLTYSQTFTEGDGIRGLFKGSPITVTVTTNINRGSITITSEMIPRPFFAQLFSSPSPIKITKVANLPPYDLSFVFDLSGSMRFATLNTYIGSAYRQIVGMSGLGTLYNDVILYQSQGQFWGNGSMITANDYVTTISSISDVIVNTPAYDIPTNSTYTTGDAIYVNNPERGYIVSSNMTTGLRRSSLTGYRISELNSLAISNEDKQIGQTYLDNRSTNTGIITTYFNMITPYIEPFDSASYAVMAFIDTVKIYGTAGLKLGLVTFESSSYTSDNSSTWTCSELEGNNSSKRIRRTLPYLGLVDPNNFNLITQKLTIMSTGGNGTSSSPILTYSYPDGGTNINAGLDNAKYTFNQSDRPNSEKIIILFTDGEPTSHTFSALGSKVKTLTDQGIKIYSVVLTLAVSQSSIDQFKYQVETIGKAEPVIFISDPAKLKDAFLQIADELGLKLVN